MSYVPPNIQTGALHPQLNAAVALFLGVYLLIVLWQGNLGALVNQARADLIGGSVSANPNPAGDHTGTGTPANPLVIPDTTVTPTGQPFWRWALAVIILIMVTELPPVRPYANALIGFVFVAMLIQLESSQPGTFSNLSQTIGQLFGRASSTGISAK